MREFAGARSGIVAAVAVVLLAAGCKTTRGKGESATEPTVDWEKRMQRVPVGERALGILKVDPKQLEKSLPAVRSAMEPVAPGSVFADESPRPLSRLVSAWLRPRPAATLTRRAEASPFRAREIDRSRALYLAILDRGNRAQFRRVWLAHPYRRLANFAHGLSARLWLPSEEPGRLAESLRSYCGISSDGARSDRCGAVARIEASDRFATVDLLYRAGGESVRAYADSLESAKTADGSYLRRLTPATKAFLDPDAPLAGYAKTADLWRLALLESRFSTVEPLATMRRSTRRRAIPRVLERLYRIASLSDPSTREFEDLALVATGGDAAAATLVQTYTERGRAVANAGAVEVELPRVEIDDPTVRFEGAFDLGAAARRAAGRRAASSDGTAEASLLERALQERARRMRILRDMGPQLLEAPVHVAGAALRTVFAGREQLEFSYRNLVRRLTGLRAARGAFRLEANEEEPFGVEPVGAAVVSVTRESNLDATLETVAAVARRAGWSVRTEVEYENGGAELRFAAGVSASVFEEPAAVRPGVSVEADLQRLSRALGWDGDENGGDENGGDENGGDEDRRSESVGIRTLQLQTGSNGRARSIRLRAGAERAGSLRTPSADIELMNPPGRRECLRRVANRSRRLARVRGGTRRGTSIAVYHGVISELSRAIAECDVGEPWRAALIDLGVAHWSRYAESLARIGLWSETAEAFRAACELGGESGCEARDRFVKRSVSMKPPSVGPLRRTREGFQLPAMVIATDRWFVGAEPVGSLSKWAGSREASPSLEQAYNARRGGSSLRSSVYGTVLLPVAVDGSLDARTFGSFADRAVGMGVGGRGRRVEASLVGALALITAPEFEARGTHDVEYLRFGSKGHLRPPEKARPILVQIDARGWTVRNSQRRLPPVDGCPQGGPTVCLADDRDSLDSELDAFEEARRTSDPEGARKRAGAIDAGYPYPRLRAALVEALRDHEPRPNFGPSLALAVDGRLPVEVVARSAAAALRATESSMESGRELFSGPAPSEPPFTRVYFELLERE